MQERRALITGGLGELATCLVQELRSQGYIVHHPGRSEMNLLDPKAIDHYFQSLPSLDLLINNAAVREDQLMARMQLEAWDTVIDTNLKGTFLCSQCAARIMISQGCGHIINIGSHSAVSGPAGQANYAASKAGVIALTHSLAKEWGPHNIRVNCVLPGWLETKFTRDLPPAIVTAALESHVLRRFNTAEEAARAIVFLDTLSHVSGQIISLDSRLHP